MFGSQNVLIHGDEDLPHTVLPPLARIGRRASHSCKADDEHCKCKQMRRAAEKVLASLRTEPRLVRVAATLGWSFPRRASAISSELLRIDSSMATAKTYQSPPMCLRKGACQYVLASVVQHRHVAVFEGEVAAVVLLDGDVLQTISATATYSKLLATKKPRRRAS